MIRFKIAREKALNILQMFRIKVPPVDVEKIAALLGFKVIPFDFPETTSAVIRIEGSSKVIGVNKNHAPVRQRFSIAHELGHYLSGHENFTHEKKIVVDPDKRYLDPEHQQEQEADEFAAELLMPEFMLKDDANSKNLNIIELAKKFNVSEQAMTIQVVNLKIELEKSHELDEAERQLRDPEI